MDCALQLSDNAGVAVFGWDPIKLFNCTMSDTRISPGNGIRLDD